MPGLFDGPGYPRGSGESAPSLRQAQDRLWLGRGRGLGGVPRISLFGGREISKSIIIAVTLAAFALTACGGGALAPTEDVVERTRGLTEPEQVTLETLPLLGTQVTLGQPFTIDASLLPGLGVPTLTGELAVNFMWTERGTAVNQETMLSVTGATLIIASKVGKATQGEFVAVHYTVENKSDSRIQPLARLTGNLNLIDSQGRKYTPAGFVLHGFLAGSGFALQSGGSDTRDWLEPGNTATTAVAFDIPLDASGLRLRSEAGNFEVELVGGAGRPEMAATPTPPPAPTATPTPTPRAATKPLPGGQSPTEYLTALIEEQFAGLTNQPCPETQQARTKECIGNLPRLNSVDVRPDRAGDLKVVIVFSVDDVELAGDPETMEAKRRDIEEQMWDGYRVLFTSPAAEHISNAIMTGQAPHGLKGGVASAVNLRTPIGTRAAGNMIIYKTRVSRDKAATIDWSTMPSEFTSCVVFDAGGSKCTSEVWDIALLIKDYRWDVPPSTKP